MTFKSKIITKPIPSPHLCYLGISLNCNNTSDPLCWKVIYVHRKANIPFIPFYGLTYCDRTGFDFEVENIQYYEEQNLFLLENKEYHEDGEQLHKALAQYLAEGWISDFPEELSSDR